MLSRNRKRTSIRPKQDVVIPDFNAMTPGTRVLAPKEPEWLYPGAVLIIQPNGVLIRFDAGDQQWVPAQDVRPLEYKVGDRVACRWADGDNFYTGVIHKIDRHRIKVHYDDFDREWTKLENLRFPSPRAPASFHRPPPWYNRGLGVWTMLVLIGVLFSFRVVYEFVR